METHYIQSTGNHNHQNKLLIDICFFYRYRIDDLVSEKMFMLDLSFYVCMEESRPSDCIVDIPILKNLKMPKPLCNWDGGFTVSSESHLLLEAKNH